MTELIANKGKTALMYACDKGNLKIIGKLIVDYKLDINAQDDKGLTALMHAVINEQKHVIELLVSLGADQSIQDKDGYTALMHACKEKDKKKYQKELEKYNDEYVENRNDDDKTALIHAIENDNKKIIEKLLEVGIKE